MTLSGVFFLGIKMIKVLFKEGGTVPDQRAVSTASVTSDPTTYQY